jgi:hypothetical protein
MINQTVDYQNYPKKQHKIYIFDPNHFTTSPHFVHISMYRVFEKLEITQLAKKSHAFIQ